MTDNQKQAVNLEDVKLDYVEAQKTTGNLLDENEKFHKVFKWLFAGKYFTSTPTSRPWIDVEERTAYLKEIGDTDSTDIHKLIQYRSLAKNLLSAIEETQSGAQAKAAELNKEGKVKVKEWTLNAWASDDLGNPFKRNGKWMSFTDVLTALNEQKGGE